VTRPHAEEPVEDEKRTSAETDIEDSNPNAAGPHGLRGDMGVSSERTGPLDGSVQPTGEDVQGTGSRGTAAANTEGTVSTSGADETVRQQPQDPADGPESESNTAEAPSHDFDPSRNPGHSHG